MSAIVAAAYPRSVMAAASPVISRAMFGSGCDTLDS
jgi:hypothetical protein